MQTEPGNLTQLTGVSKRIVRRLFSIGENRVELLLVELQEERERLLLAILMALGISVFGLLAGVGLTLTIGILFWEHSPVLALLALTALYIATASLLYMRLIRLKRDWETLPATLDQLRKDRECLEQTLT